MKRKKVKLKITKTTDNLQAVQKISKDNKLLKSFITVVSYKNAIKHY